MNSWGSQNELIIFPILELIKKEILKAGIKTPASSDSAIYSDGASNILKSNSYQKALKYAELMAYFESNDYEIDIKREDPDHPKRMTRAVITFDESTSIIIVLLRGSNGKLSGVNVNFVGKEKLVNDYVNPYNMPVNVYLEYVKNGLYYTYYSRILEDSTATPEQMDDASDRMSALHDRNVYLRNYYGVSESGALSKEDLFKYMENPYLMDVDDYRDYAFCFWVQLSDHPSVTTQVKTQYSQKAQDLRLKYGIEVEGLTFEELNNYTNNPLCMTDEDLQNLYDIKYSLVNGNLSTEEYDAMNLEKIQLYNKYYLTESVGNSWTYEALAEYLPDSENNYTIKTICSVNISLNYEKGIFKGVKSELVEGE